jgi:hypothetical protein
MWPSSDDRIRTLEHDLYSARRAVVALLPQAIQTFVESYYDCQSWHEAHAWESGLVEQILASAAVLGREDGSYFGPRAYCPLCTSGSSGPYDRGFAVPEGLRRHLLGWGNTGACSILSPVLDLARDHWRPRFEKAEAENRAKREAELAERRTRESLLLLGPNEQPVLNDERLDFDRQPRDQESMGWAEARLAQLGFELTESDRVRSFTKLIEDYVVYADPRAQGEVKFFVRRAASPAPRRRRSHGTERYQTFVLPDKWRHQLDDKFSVRLAAAVQPLRKGKHR